MRHYDAIMATYSLHHLPDAEKLVLMKELLKLLNNDGMIYIGDIAFQTRRDLEICRKQAGDAWDEDEIYFVYDDLKAILPQLNFEPYSECAGVLTLKNDPGLFNPLGFI